MESASPILRRPQLKLSILISALILPVVAQAWPDFAPVDLSQVTLSDYREGRLTLEEAVVRVTRELTLVRKIVSDLTVVRYGSGANLLYLNLLGEVYKQDVARRPLPGIGSVPAVYIEKVLVRILRGEGIRDTATRLKAGMILNRMVLMPHPRDPEVFQKLAELISNIAQGREAQGGLLPYAARALVQFSDCEAGLYGVADLPPPRS